MLPTKNTGISNKKEYCTIDPQASTVKIANMPPVAFRTEYCENSIPIQQMHPVATMMEEDSFVVIHGLAPHNSMKRDENSMVVPRIKLK